MIWICFRFWRTLDDIIMSSVFGCPLRFCVIPLHFHIVGFCFNIVHICKFWVYLSFITNFYLCPRIVRSGYRSGVRFLQISNMSLLSCWSLRCCFSWKINSWFSFSNIPFRSSSVPSQVVCSRFLSFSRAPPRLKKRCEHRLKLCNIL